MICNEIGNEIGNEIDKQIDRITYMIPSKESFQIPQTIVIKALFNNSSKLALDEMIRESLTSNLYIRKESSQIENMYLILVTHGFIPENQEQINISAINNIKPGYFYVIENGTILIILDTGEIYIYSNETVKEINDYDIYIMQSGITLRGSSRLIRFKHLEDYIQLIRDLENILRDILETNKWYRKIFLDFVKSVTNTIIANITIIMYSHSIRFLYPIDIIRKYTEGKCNDFAEVFKDKFGGEIYGLSFYEWDYIEIPDEPGTFYINPFHYVVKYENLWIDITGVYEDVNSIEYFWRETINDMGVNEFLGDFSMKPASEYSTEICKSDYVGEPELDFINIRTKPQISTEEIVDMLHFNDFISDKYLLTRFIYPTLDYEDEEFLSNNSYIFAKLILDKYGFGKIYGLGYKEFDNIIPIYYILFAFGKYIDYRGIYKDKELFFEYYDSFFGEDVYITDIDQSPNFNPANIERMSKYIDLIDNTTLFGLDIVQIPIN